MTSPNYLNRTITACRLCPRLVEWRERVAGEKVARFADQTYWGKPVPGFGDPLARLLIVGLAPAAHGANRTGRIFTGDRSGEWLYRTLHKFGFASQAESVSRTDGMQLHDCYITATVRCAPPLNKPLPEETRNCRAFLLHELDLLQNVRVVVGLGKIAHDAIFNAYSATGRTTLTKRPAFKHDGETRLNDNVLLIASYHPSQQNTFTGKLTQKMFDAVFRRSREYLSRVQPQRPNTVRWRVAT